ncbi:MAG: hypothetical protein V4541_10510 [Bacteroidota bacterium]
MEKTPQETLDFIKSTNEQIDRLIDEATSKLDKGLALTAGAFSPEGLYRYANNGRHVNLVLVVDLKEAPEIYHEEYLEGLERTVIYRHGKGEYKPRMIYKNPLSKRSDQSSPQ